MKPLILRRYLAPLAAGLGLLGACAATAEAAAMSTDTPISGSVTNSCNGDVVAVSGTEHVVVEQNANGQVSAHIDLVNASGVGISGDRYRAIQVGNVETNSLDLTSQGASEATGTLNVEYVSQGSSPNFAVEQIVHFTFNANGQMTATVVNMASQPCRG